MCSSHALFDQSTARSSASAPTSSPSDIVAIYYALYEKKQPSTLPPVVFKQDVPAEIKTRLDKYSLRFQQLPDLLKRALLWESGYSLGDNASLAQIHTLCGLSMAEIALSETEFKASGCVVDSCSSGTGSKKASFGDWNHSEACASDQLLKVTKCASTAVDRVSATSLWSSKSLQQNQSSSSSAIPNVQIRRHEWQDPEQPQPVHVYAIHSTEQEDTNVCASESASGLVIPCVPYQRSDKRWCRPEPSALMTNWLEEYTQMVLLDQAASRSNASLETTTSNVNDSVLSELKTADQMKDSHGVFVRATYKYDGTSSDFAQQFYRRYRAGDGSDATGVSKLTIDGPLPKEIAQRLADASLGFDDLPPLLQRALVWDSGYAFGSGAQSNTLTAVYVECGLAMSDVAMSRETASNAGCEVQTCSSGSDPLQVSHRSTSCASDQIMRKSRCAVASANDVKSSDRIAVWADGGDEAATPELNVVKYTLASDNASFVMFGIHAVRESEGTAASSTCPEKASMVIPCVPYTSDEGAVDGSEATLDDGAWCRPESGALVTSWLRQVAKEKQFSLLHLVPILVAVALTVTGLALYIRRKAFKRFDGKCEGSRQTATAIVSTPDGTYTSGRLSLSQRSSATVGDARLSGLSPSSIESFAAFSSNGVLNTLVNHPSLRLNTIAYDQLQFHNALSKNGSLMEVWMGSYRGANVAIKCLANRGKIQYDELEAFIGEITLNASLEHQNIATFIGVSWNTLQNLCMVTEYFDNGDLQLYLAQRCLQLSWEQNKMHIALGIANAICYLHQQRPAVLHHDLKAKHVVLTAELDAKLISCGSKRSKSFESTTGVVDAPFWTAPEVLQGHAYSDKSDMYSFGMVLSELDTHQPPYDGIKCMATGEDLSAVQILEKVVAGELRPTLSPLCPQEIAELIEACLHPDPQQRPSASAAIVVLAKVPIAAVGAKSYSF